MKKLNFMITILFLCVLGMQAQNDTIMTIQQLYGHTVNNVCRNKYDRVIIYAPCDDTYWYINSQPHHGENPIILDGSLDTYSVQFGGCGYNAFTFAIFFIDPDVPAETTTELWKRQHGVTTLEAPGGYTYLWSTGETTASIEVTEPGTYTCDVSDMCATSVQTFIVKDNVELYRATCDLSTNLNQITWQTTPEQAEYISQVKVYRNTYQLVATASYLDGSFTDNIGSDATQWQYHLVAVDTDGNDCPIPSYWKRTIHLDHVQGTQGEILQWTPYEEENPSKDVVIAYAIYDVVDGEPRHVIDVGNFTNVYAYNPNDFYGYGTVAAVFNSKKGLEELAFSNLTPDILSIGKVTTKNLSIYPNPSDGTFTVEGTTRLTIYNILGQIMATSYDEDEIHTFTLTPGLYFVKSGEGMTKKVVVQ